ncbi:MAG: methyltransferase [Polyangiaceae bacterium]
MTYRTLTTCRFCGARLRSVMHLGLSPIANNLCETQEEALAASTHPLQLMACQARDCGLYQLSVTVPAEELFPAGYTYSTPENPELAAHYDEAVRWLQGLLGASRVCVEIGSNNGRFLKEMQEKVCLHCVGVEPSMVPTLPGITTKRAFFTEEAAQSLNLTGQVNLVVARHCLAHIDDVHEVLRGVKKLLAPDGIFYIENAYAVNTFAGGQFDQIYHEHLSYFTLRALSWLLRLHNMRLLDVKLSSIHGGSLMVAAVREDARRPASSSAVDQLLLFEDVFLEKLESDFLVKTQKSISSTHYSVNQELASVGRSVDAWGAAAKAVTRFGACKLTHKHIRQCYDDSQLKQGKFLPGSGIPIVPCPAELESAAVLLTAWNYERSFRARYASYEGTVLIP